MSIDPLASFTRAPYMYAQDNPVNRADLTGLCTGFGPEPDLCTGGPNELGKHVFCEPSVREIEQSKKEQEEDFNKEAQESESLLKGQDTWGDGGEPYGGEPKDAPPELDDE